LFLGSASLALLGQTSESLAGRVAYAELSGIDVANSRKTDSPELTPILSGFAEDIPTA